MKKIFFSFFFIISILAYGENQVELKRIEKLLKWQNEIMSLQLEGKKIITLRIDDNTAQDWAILTTTLASITGVYMDLHSYNIIINGVLYTLRDEEEYKKIKELFENYNKKLQNHLLKVD